MSVAPISNHAIQPYFEQRSDDLSQLARALQSGDLAASEKAYASIVALGKNGPFPKGVPFIMPNREQDFQAIGKALQAGDLDGARQAMGALARTFQQAAPSPAMSGAGPDAVVTLSSSQ